MNIFYSPTFTFEFPLDGSHAGPSTTAPYGWPQFGVDEHVNPPCDEVLTKKVAHNQHYLREIESQWNLPIPWSNSTGVNPKDIFGLAPPSVPLPEDDIENHPPAPKRRKTKVWEDEDYIDDAFPPVDYYVAPPTPSSASTSQLPASQKSRGKRPRSAPESEDADSTYTPAAHTAPSDDRAIPGLRHVRCRWNGCKELIERVHWQAHMDSAHRLRSQVAAHTGRWHCQFSGCRSDTGSHASMVRHLKTKHFLKRVHVCESCGDAFSRSDSRNRHVEKKSCGAAKGKRRDLDG
ncbi:hypothetical protein VTO73DRAFT_10123 [Trametes versicolor]